MQKISMKNSNRSNKIKVFLERDEYINQLACAKNEISISNRNSKTGVLINDLAFPTCTCRDDAPCKISHKCYCMKGHQCMANVQAAYVRNLRLYNENPKDFWEQVDFKVKHYPLPKFRYFDCGDFPRKEFIKEAYDFAKKYPNIEFLAYTKHYDWVNETIKEYGREPDNFTIRFSAWDKNWHFDNPYGLPVAYVDFKDSDMNPIFPKTASCPNQKDKAITCSICGLCWHKDVEVKFLQH